MMSRRQWAVGLMSGTSADGIDAALIRIRLRPLQFELAAFQSTPYSPSLYRRVLAAAESRKKSVNSFQRLDHDLGLSFAAAVRKVCRKGGVPLSRLAWIGSHGQTVFHSRTRTVQLADPKVIAAQTAVVTVADFRQADMALGGLGAPLTPYFNYHYFRQARVPIVVQNIGGIANLTYLPAGSKVDRVVAFDTGPGNMVIDALVRRLSRGRESFDRGGKRARRGTVHAGLLSRMAAGAFIRKSPPKACGREQYGAGFTDRFIKQAKKHHLSGDDMIATATALTARSIADNCRRFLFRRGQPREMIVCGGGAKNPTLLNMLAQELPELNVLVSDERGLPADAAEAVAFAFFAGETLAGRPSNLPKVTGAKKKAVLGKIFYP